jgi:hypothetical protein
MKYKEIIKINNYNSGKKLENINKKSKGWKKKLKNWKKITIQVCIS